MCAEASEYGFSQGLASARVYWMIASVAVLLGERIGVLTVRCAVWMIFAKTDATIDDLAGLAGSLSLLDSGSPRLSGAQPCAAGAQRRAYR